MNVYGFTQGQAKFLCEFQKYRQALDKIIELSGDPWPTITHEEYCKNPDLSDAVDKAILCARRIYEAFELMFGKQEMLDLFFKGKDFWDEI